MKLFVEFINTYPRETELIHLGECATPIRRRIAWITLSAEQAEQLRLREVGMNCGKIRREDFGNVWIEMGGEE